MVMREDERQQSPREWRATNATAYSALWCNQRTALGLDPQTPFGEWFELNWETGNRYWKEFLGRHAPGRRLLECGGATGRLPAILAGDGWECTLVDLTHEGPLLARARFEEGGRRGRFVRGDVFALPFADDSFDVVYSNGLLDVLPSIENAIAEMTRVLRPGGLFVAASNPRRRSVQTFTEDLLAWARRVRRFVRPASSNRQPRPAR